MYVKYTDRQICVGEGYITGTVMANTEAEAKALFKKGLKDKVLSRDLNAETQESRLYTKETTSIKIDWSTLEA